MAKTYSVSAEGWDGHTYDVTITHPSRSGSASLVGDRQYITIGDFSGDGTRKPGVVARPLQLSVLNTSDLTPLDDIAEDEVTVRVERQATGNDVYLGYLRPSQIETTPLSPDPDVVTLHCTEGVGTLESQSFGDFSFSGDAEITVQKALVACIQSVFGVQIPIDLSMDWFPETSTLSSTDSPLLNAWIDPAMYREDRGNEEGWWTKRQVLGDILRGIGCQLLQSQVFGELRWHVRNAQCANTNGEMPRWEIGESASIQFGLTPYTVSLQPAADNDRIDYEHVGNYERARSAVRHTHNHLSVDNYLQEGGFENRGLYWTLPDTSVVTTEAVPHDAYSQTPNGTADNFHVCKIEFGSTAAGNSIETVLEQGVTLIPPGPHANLQLTWSSWRDDRISGRLEYVTGGQYATDFETSVQGDANEGETQLQVQPISFPIPEGSKLMLTKVGSQNQATIEVQERAPRGATSITGRLSNAVDSSWKLYYFGFTSSQDTVLLDRVVPIANEETWTRQSLILPYQDGNGNALPGRSPTLRLKASSAANAGVIDWFVDDITLQPVVGGQVLDETVHEAAVDTPGTEDEDTTRLGSGPAVPLLSRTRGDRTYQHSFPILGYSLTDEVRVDGDATQAFSQGGQVVLLRDGLEDERYEVEALTLLSGSNETLIKTVHDITNRGNTNGTVEGGLQSSYTSFFWGVGANPSPTYPLGELRARQRLRYHRAPNRRLEVTEHMTEDSDDIFGHELIEFQGRLWTIESIRTKPHLAEGTRELTLLELKDNGTA